MQKGAIIIILILISSCIQGQEFAIFQADTTRLRRFYRDGNDLPARISDQEWIINGHILKYGSKEVKIRVNPDKLDTILYKGYRRPHYDTIICNVSKPQKYSFCYNECCGAFNIHDNETKKFIVGSIIFKVKQADTSLRYLGTMDDAGLLIKTGVEDTLRPNCRSAMSPNVYEVIFSQIKICEDDEGCEESVCIQKGKKKDVNYGFSFRTISRKFRMLYMPLGTEPLIFNYDCETNAIRIR